LGCGCWFLGYKPTSLSRGASVHSILSRMTIELLKHLAATSAVFNGVAIPGRKIEATIARYAFNVFILNDSPEFPVSMRGTGTAVRLDGHDLFVCTQHQLEGVDREKVGMMTDGGGMLVTSGGTRYFTPSVETDANDLVVFNFTEPVAAFPQFRSRFFNLGWPQNLNTDPVAYLVTGCAYDDQSYDVADSNHIGVARRSVVCTLDDEQPSDPALVRLRSGEPLSFDPDGMSGGSAFVVHRDQSGFWVDFAGIIVRGGGTGFHIVKAAVVYRFLKTCAWPKPPVAKGGPAQRS
jgi:hypothetical protein